MNGVMEMDKSAHELFSLTREANDKENLAQNCEVIYDGTSDMEQEEPLNIDGMRKKIQREEWENLREDIRRFKSSCEGIGKYRESMDEDIGFRVYIFESNVPEQYL